MEIDNPQTDKKDKQLEDMPPGLENNNETDKEKEASQASETTGNIDEVEEDEKPREISLNELGKSYDKGRVKEIPDLPPVEEFAALELEPELMEAISTAGWTKPTPVQALCLPNTINGRDVAGFAQTGTGKTGVFLITVANAILKAKKSGKDKKPFAVVIAPTRELAIQIFDEADRILKPLGIESLAVYGGADWEKQAQQLKTGVDIILATPGRLKDFHSKKVVNFDQSAMFVCDEVDRMFDMGFIEDVEYFLANIPEKCQKLLFSATTNDHVKELAFEYLDHPAYLSVSPEEITPDRINQHAILCETQHKLLILLGLLKEHQPERAIIFTNTKLTAEWLHYKLVGNKLDANIITGDLSQNKRIRLIRRIKNGEVKILIATDVASRGLHIAGVTHVYNFDIPDEAANYVHRIGRTARAGEKGASFSLVDEEYGENFAAIQELLGESAPECEWYDTAHLSLEDQSGNPFVDNFGKGHEDDFRRGRDHRRGGKGRDRDRDRDRDRRPQRDRMVAKDRSKHKGKKREEKAASLSIFGWIKWIFATLFGWTKKKKAVLPDGQRPRNKRNNNYQGKSGNRGGGKGGQGRHRDGGKGGQGRGNKKHHGGGRYGHNQRGNRNKHGGSGHGGRPNKRNHDKRGGGGGRGGRGGKGGGRQNHH